MQLCGKRVPRCGILVVRDLPGGVPALVPGVLGMNVIRKCYSELFVRHGAALFSQRCVSEGPTQVLVALQQCHRASLQTPRDHPGLAKIRGKKAWRIPGGVTKVVAATCSQRYSSSTVLFEPSDSGLPDGLLVSPALVRVIRGTVYIPILNVGSTDVVLHPHTTVGMLDHVNVVSLPSGITEVPSVVATVSSQTAPPSVQHQLEDLDLSSLSGEQQCQVRSLLRQYTPVFSAYEGDLGCTNLISHDIPLVDIPVRQRYRRIPPSEYEVVKEHINQ